MQNPEFIAELPIDEAVSEATPHLAYRARSAGAPYRLTDLVVAASALRLSTSHGAILESSFYALRPIPTRPHNPILVADDSPPEESIVSLSFGEGIERL